MRYEEFKENIKARAEKISGKGGKVSINQITKNNGLILDGLIIMREGDNASPTIYLNDYYKQYMKGRTIENIYDEIEKGYYDSMDNLQIDMDFYSSFDNVSDKIIYKLVNYEKNKELLEKVPYKRVLDLALVFYCMISNNDTESATTLIYNSHLEMWGVTEKDIYEKAVENTPKLLKCDIKSMSEILMDFISAGDESFESDMPEMGNPDMYVMTNGIKINGAACILYKNALKDFSEKVNSDLFILPSSIHEVIIIPQKEQYDIEHLQDMVHEVNTEGVASDEILSDNVYIYNRKNNCISM